MCGSDPHTSSNFDSFKCNHVDLDWNVNFGSKCIEGSSTTHLTCKVSNANQIVLDCHHLVIKSVSVSTLDGLHVDTTFNCKDDSQFGGALVIYGSYCENSSYKVQIMYHTTPNCTALQWLHPGQTKDGLFPFLFSQCQAIHARTMLPCQDTPSSRFTYSAHVKIADRFAHSIQVVMSANVRTFNEELGVFEFKQTNPIPAYLIAIGAGHLERVSLGPRTALWCEPSLVKSASYEFADTEKFLTIAEEIAGPYRWEIYEILLLPPSFPYGGMENPCLTFLTPSILAGDRSLVDVVAHEISHSWTGNLVACASWEHFWLNEGFTMYLERKILSKLYGESYRQFDSLIGLADLRESIALFGKFSPATALSPCLKTTHPDDVFSSVPYEKGYTLLYVLEQFVGGPSKFDPFFRAYIDHFSWMAIDSNQFVQFTKDFFDPQNDQLKSFPWDTWIKGTGMPVVIPQYSQQLVEPCHHLALLTKKLDEKLSSEVDGKPPIIHPNYLDESAMQSTAKIEPNSEKSTNSLELEHPPCEFGLVDITEMKELLYSKYRELSPPQKVMYLDILLVQVGDGSLVDPLRIGHLLSDIFSQEMMSVDNVEILLKWHLLNIRTGNVHAFKAASIFATKHGRMKYCRPILRELYASGAKELACQTFNSNREFYHPIAAQMICKDLHLSY